MARPHAMAHVTPAEGRATFPLADGRLVQRSGGPRCSAATSTITLVRVPAAPVVVVGAGPVGLTAALLLSARGLPVHVVRAAPRALSPAPRRAPRRRGVPRAAGGRGGRRRARRAAARWPGSGCSTAGTGCSPSSAGPPTPACTAGRRARSCTSPISRRCSSPAATADPRITVERGVEVTGLRPGRRRRHADAVPRDGGADRSVRASAVLGCDGANSTVRGADRRDDAGARAARPVAGARRPVGRPAAGVARRPPGLRPAPPGDVHAGDRRTATAGSAGWRRGRRSPDLTTPAFLARLLAPVDPAAVEFVRAVEYTFRAQVADRWRAGRVLLAGDAAHLSPPFVGQGLGLGLRDVHQLAWKLADVLTGAAGDDLLDTYQAEREPHARALIGVARLLGRLMTGGGRAGSALRRGVLTAVRRIPAVERLATDSRTPAAAERAARRAARDERAVGWPGCCCRSPRCCVDGRPLPAGRRPGRRRGPRAPGGRAARGAIVRTARG